MMLLDELSRLVLDSNENTDDLSEGLRSFLRAVEAKQTEIVDKKEISALDKWNKKLMVIIIIVKNFPTEFQLAVEVSIYTKIFCRLLSKYIDLNLNIARKSRNPDEHLFQAFRDLVLLIGDRNMLPNIWSIMANSSIVEAKQLKHLEGLAGLALNKIIETKAVHSNHQYIRLIWIVNKLASDPAKFDKITPDALQVKVIRGFDEYLQHIYRSYGWGTMSLVEIQQRFFTRNNRPKATFFNNLQNQIGREDVESLNKDQRNFQEQLISTSVSKIGESTSKYTKIIADETNEVLDKSPPSKSTVLERLSENMILPPITETASTTTKRSTKGNSENRRSSKTISEKSSKKPRTTESELESENNSVVSSTTPKTTRRVLRETPQNVKRKLAEANENESDDDIVEVEPEPQTITKKGWEVLWRKVSGREARLVIDRVDLSNYKKISNNTYSLRNGAITDVELD